MDTAKIGSKTCTDLIRKVAEDTANVKSAKDSLDGQLNWLKPTKTKPLKTRKWW